jgi:VWFA-related protein
VRLAVFAAAAAGPLAAQPPAVPPTPRFEAEVAVVALPVFVTDKQGQPVSGLVAADFEVTDEGKPVAVLGVQEIDAVAPVPVDADTPTAMQAAAARQFLFLFDLSFSHPAGIVRARKAAQRIAEDGLAPSDLAAVATYSVNGGVKLPLGFTTDRQQLARALDTLGVLQLQKAPDPLGLAFDLWGELGLQQPEPKEGGSRYKEDELYAFVREQVQLARRGEDAVYGQRVSGFLSSLRQLARTLDAVRGRKQVILLSAGFDETPLMGATGDQATKDAEAVTEGRLWDVRSESRFGDASVREAMDAMVKMFAASDAVVHAVDVSGLLAGGDAASGIAGLRPGAGRESLNQIANLTGGRMIKDTNDLTGALRNVIDASRRYYVLAFEPAPRGPGKFHRLKVRVKTRGLDVGHRAGYLEPAAARVDDPMLRRMQAAEAIAKGLSGGDLDVRLVAVPYRDAQGRLTLPVVVEVDGGRLITPGAKGELPLEVYGYALDEKGAILDAVALAPRLELAKLGARVRESGLQLHTAFGVSAGTVDLRFLVRDGSTGRMGSRRLVVAMPPFTSGSVVVSPPLFMADPAGRLVLQTASRRNPTVDMPFRVDADLFTPQGLPRLANGRTDSVCVLAFSPTPFDAKSSFQISAHLTDRAGARVPIGAPLSLARLVAEADGFRRFVLKLTPANVPAGDYTFRVRIKDPLSGESAESAQLVRFD